MLGTSCRVEDAGAPAVRDGAAVSFGGVVALEASGAPAVQAPTRKSVNARSANFPWVMPAVLVRLEMDTGPVRLSAQPWSIGVVQAAGLVHALRKDAPAGAS